MAVNAPWTSRAMELRRRMGIFLSGTESRRRRHGLEAREKLNLLSQLRANAAGAEAEGRPFGFSSAGIDEAVAHVRRGVQDGVGAETVFKGDF